MCHQRQYTELNACIGVETPIMYASVNIYIIECADAKKISSCHGIFHHVILQEHIHNNFPALFYVLL